MRKYYQLIPERIQENIQVIETTIQPRISGYQRDNLYELISIVAFQIRKNGEAAPLMYNYLRKLVPQGEKYLKALIELDIIKRSGNAIPGKTSYQYRFSDQYDSRYVSIELTNQKLIRRIELARNELQKVSAKTTRGRSDQIKYLKKLKIDGSYINILNHNYIKDTNKYNSILASATKIQNGDIFYTVDDTAGRFHSNITNMSKDLRPYLRINGQKLVNIDVKNCQPYLSVILLTDPGKVSCLTDNREFCYLLTSMKVTITQDVKNYISLVASGQIYEYLMEKFSSAGLELSRSETKKQVLRILFARNRTPKNETNRFTRQIFIKNFPTVHKIFSQIRGKEKGEKFSNFKRFAILLQRIEAKLMLDVVVKRIYKELPGVIALTIHDSIMTGFLTNDVKAVREIIEEVLTEFVGLRPVIKVEREKEEEREREVQYVYTDYVSIK